MTYESDRKGKIFLNLIYRVAYYKEARPKWYQWGH